MTKISRDELYEQVWSIPGSKLATTFGVSDSYLRRVCVALDVPRPPRGYWQQTAAGKIQPRPPLPPRSALRPSSWSRVMHGAPTLIGPLYKRFDCSRAELLERTARAMSRAKSGFGEEYLRPRGRGILDLTATARSVTRALEIFDKLASSLERGRYVLRVLPPRETLYRPTIDPRRGSDLMVPLASELWTPVEFTVVNIGQCIFRLSLYESCTLVDMRYVGFGRYKDAASMPQRKVYGDSWVEKKWTPTGKFELEAHLVKTQAPATAKWSEFDDEAAFADTDWIVHQLEQLASGD